MTKMKKYGGIVGLCASGVIIAAACNAFNAPGTSGTPAAGSPAPGLSQGRQNAARDIAAVNSIRVELRQQDLGDPLQHRCFPLGDGVNVPWDLKTSAVPFLDPSTTTSEYDILEPTVGETDYILSIRSINPVTDDNFTALEFSFRAVNPFVDAHVPGTDYVPAAEDEARFPSNDDVPANRTLVDLFGGDVAIIVQGISFTGLPPAATTKAFMNFLGPTGWVFFMRDNAFQSGRFYRLTGALTCGPKALEDTPSLLDDGFFNSVQVNGTNFDFLDEPAGATIAAAAPSDFHQLCAGTPGALVPDPLAEGTAKYSFLDISGRDSVGAAATAQGGFIFVARNGAFQAGGTPERVVLDPGVCPAALPLASNTIPAPFAGYDEPTVPGINNPDAGGAGEFDHSADVIPGVHEIGVSVFFIHSGF